MFSFLVLSCIDYCFPVSILGSILNGKMVFEDGKCRTAEFNPIIALLMGQEPIIIKNGVSFCTETPLLYPELGMKIEISESR